MDHTAGVFLGGVCLGILLLAAFATYRWRQRVRDRRVKEWVRSYLVTRFGKLPDDLDIQCTDDRLWPVLVAFDRPGGGTRQVLRFACHGPPSSFSLLSERETAHP